MRIAIDARPLAAPMGGIRRYTESLLRGLAKVDKSNHYLLYNLPRWIKLPPLGDNFEPLTSQPWVDRVRRHLWLPTEVDLVHGTNYAAPLMDRRPVVLTIHDLTVKILPHTHPSSRRFRHLLLPTLCHRAARIIADSQNTKRDLIHHYRISPSKVDVVYLANDPNCRLVTDPNELRRVQVRYRLPDRFALFVGSVEPRKNLSALIEPLKIVKSKGIPVPFVIAGRPDPDCLADLRKRLRAAQLSEPTDVLFTGPVAEPDLPALYSLCEMFIYPSLYEGFGLPPLEAMACRKPVVLPRNSSLAELYEGCALFVDIDSPEKLAAAIVRLLVHQEPRAVLVEQGMKLAHSRSWIDVAGDTLRVYETIARPEPIARSAPPQSLAGFQGSQPSRNQAGKALTSTRSS